MFIQKAHHKLCEKVSLNTSLSSYLESTGSQNILLHAHTNRLRQISSITNHVKTSKTYFSRVTPPVMLRYVCSQTTTKLSRPMYCWATVCVAHKCTCPSRWPSCGPNWRCRCFRVSLTCDNQLTRCQDNKGYVFNRMRLHLNRDHASLPDGARRGAIAAAAVPAALAGEHGTGGGQCAASHTAVLHCGECWVLARHNCVRCWLHCKS